MSENMKNKELGRTGLTEPVIMSGKCLGIKLLSVYDFMICTKMLRELVEDLEPQGFDTNLCITVCERACVVSMCLYDSKNQKIFKNGFCALKGLTPDELHFLYREYVKLQKKILRRDKITYNILESVKKYKFKKLLDSSEEFTPGSKEIV